MSTNLYPGKTVTHQSSGDTGRLLGPFTRKGVRYWTIHWESGETTAEREEDIK